MKRTAQTIALMLALCSSARAYDCGNDDATQAKLDTCADQAFRRSDVELNKKFNTIATCLEPGSGARQALQGAQRAWITFRDAECRFQSSASQGGSVQPLVIAECLKAKTDQRNKDLDYYLKCEEGDLSCPVPSTCTSRDPAPQRPTATPRP